MKTILPTALGRALMALLVLLTAGPASAGNGPDVSLYLMAKGQHLRQVGSGVPALLPAVDGPFGFVALVEPSYLNAVANASLQLPGGANLPMEQDGPDSSFEIFEGFGTKAAMDAAFGSGTYTFTIATAVDGVRTPARAFGPDAYPANHPRITNYPALQGADPSVPLTLRWEAFSGGTADDFVQVTVEDDNGEVFATGSPGQFDALDGTHTFVTVPAGWLASNTTYTVYLIFANVVSSDETNYPGVLGLSAFFKETEFRFTTGATPPPPPAAGRFVLSSSAYTHAENDGGATITIQRLGGTSGPAGVTLTTRAGTATPGLDYLESTNTYAFGDGVESVNVPVSILDDSLLDPGETVHLTLSDPTGGADLGSLSNAVLTILDNEAATRGVFQFAPAALAVDEASGRATLTVTRSGGSLGEVSVIVETQDGTATAPDDYATQDATLVFSNGVASRTITIPVVNDSIDESNETFTVTLSQPSGGAALGPNHTATVTVRDNDSSGTLSFSAAAYMVGETGGVVNLIVRRVGGAASDVSVEFATENGTATSPDDYAGTNFTITLASNELARTIPIAIQPDRLPEGDETFRATLRNPSPGARIGPVTNTTVTIKDDEVTLQFTSLAYSNRENAAVAILMIERTGPLTVAASVDVATVAGGSATPGVDYVATNLTVQFPPGSRKKPVGIRLLNDQIVEGNETLAIELSNPSDNALLGPRSQASLTLVDDDRGGKIQFALTNLTVPEARPSALVIVTRTMGLASNVTIRLQTMDVTATDGADYLGTNVVLEWRGNEVRKTLSLPLRPDAIVEGVEQFKLTLSDPTGGATLDAKSQMTVNLRDDDAGGVIGFARAEYLVNENGTNALILVTRAGGAASNVTVRFTALEGNAAAPADFAEQNLVVSFAAGEVSKTLLVPIVNDTTAEGTPETVLLALREFTGGARPSALSNATLRIIDDESSVAFNAATASGTEGSSVTLTVTRSGALNTTVTVGYTTMGGTATDGVDYTTTSGTLTFAPNQPTRTIVVPLTADPLRESNETFTVVLNNPQGGVQLGTHSSVTVSIADRPDPNAIPAAGNSFMSVRLQGIEGNPFSDSWNSGDIVTAPLTAVYDSAFQGGAFHPLNANRTSVSGTTATSRNLQFGILRFNSAGVIQLTSDTANGSAIFTKQSSGTGGVSSAIYVSNQPGGGGTVTIDVFDLPGGVVTGRFDIIVVESAGLGRKARLTGSFRVKGQQLVIN